MKINNRISKENFISNFFDLLNQKNIKTVVLRNYHDLPKDWGNDLDLCIDFFLFNKFESILTEFVNSNNGRVFDIIRRPNVILFRAFIEIDGLSKLLKIDLLNGASWKGIEYISNKDVLDNSIKHHDWYIPCKEHEIIICLLQELLWNGRIKTKYRTMINKTFCNSGTNIEKILIKNFSKRVTEFILFHVKNKEYARIEESISNIRISLIFRNILTQPFGLIFSVVKYFISELVITSKRHGRFITIIGPDGVGKSKIAQYLLEELSGIYRDYFYFHWRIPIIGGMKKEVDNIGEEHSNTVNSFRGKIQILLSYPRLIKNMILNYIGFALNIYWRLLRQNLIISDRYLFSYSVYPESLKYYGGGGMAIKLLKLQPQPDLLIILIASPQAIHKRKKELTVSQIKVQIQKCTYINKIFHNSILIDNSDDFSIMKNRVLTEVLSKI